MAETPDVPEEIEATTVDETEEGTLEEDDFSFEDVEDTDEEQSDEEEPTEEEESTEETPDDGETSEDGEAEEEDEPEDEAPAESTDEPDEAERKRLNDEYAKRRIAERQEKERLKREQQEKYLQDAEDERDLALRQLQIDAYQNKVESNRNRLESGVDRAIAEIELLREGPPEVKEYLLSKVDEFERNYVKLDRNGDPVSVDGDIYEFLKKEEDSIRRLMGVGARQNARDKTKTRSKAIPRPSKTPKQPKVDPDLAAFDEEVAKWS